MATRLGKLGAAAAILQLLVTVGVPLMQFFLVFNMQVQHMHILITTGTCAVIAAGLGFASAFSKGHALPALHVVAAILLAALMGGFNTQVFLGLDNRCSIQQAAMAGCTRCACAATSSCKEADLVGAACGACRAPGTDLCARVRWQLLIMPYTGLIEAVLLAVPGFISLLLLVQRISGGSSSTVADSGYGRALMGGGGGGNDVKVMVSALGHSEAEDWPSTTPADELKGVQHQQVHLHAPSSSWQQASQGQVYGAVADSSGTQGLSAEQSQQDHGALEGEVSAGAKKKSSGLKKKAKASIAAAGTGRGEAAIGGY